MSRRGVPCERYSVLSVCHSNVRLTQHPLWGRLSLWQIQAFFYGFPRRGWAATCRTGMLWGERWASWSRTWIGAFNMLQITLGPQCRLLLIWTHLLWLELNSQYRDLYFRWEDAQQLTVGISGQEWWGRLELLCPKACATSCRKEPVQVKWTFFPCNSLPCNIRAKETSDLPNLWALLYVLSYE